MSDQQLESPAHFNLTGASMLKLSTYCNALTGFLFLFLLLPTASTHAVSLADGLYAAFPSSSEIEVTFAEPLTCDIPRAPTSKYHLYQMLFDDCQIKVRELSGSRPKMVFYRSPGLFESMSITYTKKGGTLYDFFRRYFPDWELHGEAVGAVTLSNSWRPATIGSLLEELSPSYLVKADATTKRFYILEEHPMRQSTSDLFYAIFYEFDDLNQDFYELVKSYAKHVEVVQYARNGRHYLKISPSEGSREALSKTYTYLKALFDDRIQKAQKLGSYFLEHELENLRILYFVLSDSKILAFYESELRHVGLSQLIPLGLEQYSTRLAARLQAEGPTALPLPIQATQPRPSTSSTAFGAAVDVELEPVPNAGGGQERRPSTGQEAAEPPPYPALPPDLIPIPAQ